MNTRTNLLATLMAALALGVAIPGFAAETLTEAQVAAASTPAEHEAIAQAYDAKASAAEREANEHRAMARTYKTGGAPKVHSPVMVKHCERLATSYQSAAAEYRALAAEHRKLAAAAK